MNIPNIPSVPQKIKDYKPSGLIELFFWHAEHYPHHPAIITTARTVSYAELANQARGLAACLQQLGVRHETPVGILFNAGIAQIVCQVAILLAGGTCVPLNVDAPDERLDFMLAEVRAQLTITDAPMSQRPLKTRFIELESYPVASRNETDFAGHRMPPSHRTHIFFTSGSTGRPKAVEIEARGILRLVVDTHYLNLSDDDRFGNFSSPDFDASLLEIWGALLNGASAVIIPKDILLDPEQLSELMGNFRVSLLMITPSLFNFILTQCSSAFRSLRYLMIGGEVFNRNAYALLPANERPKQVYHVYGTTEDTTFTSYHPIVADDMQAESVPIGQPLDKTEIFILDEQLQPVADGAIGEICIGGDGLARGYFNQPELTRQKFILVAVSGAIEPRRLYKTGDLGWRRANGDLMFSGRKDNQIKVQGYRIEAEEIEVQLMASGMLQAAAVCSIKLDGGESYLLAFIVPNVPAGFSAARLLDELKHRLPPYMLPRLQVIDAIPLTPSGKANRVRLLEQYKSQRFSGQA